MQLVQVAISTTWLCSSSHSLRGGEVSCSQWPPDYIHEIGFGDGGFWMVEEATALWGPVASLWEFIAANSSLSLSSALHDPLGPLISTIHSISASTSEGEYFPLKRNLEQQR